jgi:hypothetical protein
VPQSIVFSSERKRNNTFEVKENTNVDPSDSQTRSSTEITKSGMGHDIITLNAKFFVFNELESQFKMIDENVIAKICNVSTQHNEFKCIR